MAESKRRADDAVDEPFDDALNGSVDDDAVSEDDLEVAERDEVAQPRVRGARRSAVATRPAARPKAAKPSAAGVNPIARLARFIREVVAELRKVNWPNRKELLTYTAVVVVFVTVVLAIVGLLDFAFAKAVLYVFGNPKK